MSTAIYGEALLGPDAGVQVRDSDGSTRPFQAHLWDGPLDAADRAVVARVAGATLDVGCGPGRFVTALAERGEPVLGIDIAPIAVERARRGGGFVLLRSIFGPVPGHGRWEWALLIDGNVGIGGDPVRLLRRIATLLRPGGTVMVEVGAPGSPVGPWTVRLESRDEVGAWFPWARASVDSIADTAVAAGLLPGAPWREGERWFAELVRP